MKNIPNSQNYDWDINRKIVIALDRISEVMRAILWSEYDKHRLSPIQIKFLIFFLIHPPQRRTVSHLAVHYHLTKPTVSEAVKTLEKKGLVIRKSESKDKRVITLYLTKKGTELARHFSGFATEIIESLYGMDNEKKASLLGCLFDLIDRLHRSGIMRSARICLTCYNFEVKNNMYRCKRRNKTMKSEELRIDCYNHASEPAA